MGAEWQGLDVWLREYKKAVKKGMRPDNVWPSDLRLAYNNAMVQIDRSYMCMCPKAFFGGIDYYFPLLCRCVSAIALTSLLKRARGFGRWSVR
jgi:hypothetical protein